MFTTYGALCVTCFYHVCSLCDLSVHSNNKFHVSALCDLVALTSDLLTPNLLHQILCDAGHIFQSMMAFLCFSFLIFEEVLHWTD